MIKPTDLYIPFFKQKGAKKDDLSKFVELAVLEKLFSET